MYPFAGYSYLRWHCDLTLPTAIVHPALIQFYLQIDGAEAAKVGSRRGLQFFEVVFAGRADAAKP